MIHKDYPMTHNLSITNQCILPLDCLKSAPHVSETVNHCCKNPVEFGRATVMVNITWNVASKMECNCMPKNLHISGLRAAYQWPLGLS